MILYNYNIYICKMYSICILVDIPVVFFHKDVPSFSRSVGCSSWKSESTRPRWMKLPVAIRPPSRRQVFSVWVMLESEGQVVEIP